MNAQENHRSPRIIANCILGLFAVLTLTAISMTHMNLEEIVTSDLYWVTALILFSIFAGRPILSAITNEPEPSR